MDERQLVALCRQGQTDRYAVLVQRHQRVVYGLALHLLRSKEEAEDVAQEAFVRVYQQILSEKDLDFLPYLKRVTTNLCLDLLRKRQTAAKYMEQRCSADIIYQETLEQNFIHHAEQQLLRQALQNIPDMYREVLVLHYASNLTYEKIAITLSQPITIVKNRIYRGKKLLKEAYLALEGGKSNEMSRSNEQVRELFSISATL